MTRTQFWIATCSSVLVGLLFFAEIFLARQARDDDRKLGALERLVQEGNDYSARWEKLALRTYQLSQQDPVLKEVLVRQKINVTPPPTTSSPRTGPPTLRPSANLPPPTTTAQPSASAPESASK